MIELLGKQHNRTDFDCGKELLNFYLKYQAGQDVARKLSACFVLPDRSTNRSTDRDVPGVDRSTDPGTDRIQGYYTLSNNSIPLGSLPDHIRKKLPKTYFSIPATLLGRLAIDKDYQKRGIGKILLIDALKRSYEVSHEIGSFAVVVDPMDEEAEAFYEQYDFIKLPDSGKMFIAIPTLKQLFG